MKTLALVVGNNNYSKNAKLENAINDAKAISEIFEKLGYDVIFKEDMSNADCSELLSQFEEKINASKLKLQNINEINKACIPLRLDEIQNEEYISSHYINKNTLFYFDSKFF